MRNGVTKFVRVKCKDCEGEQIVFKAPPGTKQAIEEVARRREEERRCAVEPGGEEVPAPEPKWSDGESSNTSSSVTSRSSTNFFTNGWFMRAVTFQSMARTSSPAWPPIIDREVDGPNSLPLSIDRENPNLGRYSATRRVVGSSPTSAPCHHDHASSVAYTSTGAKSLVNVLNATTSAIRAGARRRVAAHPPPGDAHTRAVTTFRNLAPRGRVNLEVDMIARYVERMLANRAK